MILCMNFFFSCSTESGSIFLSVLKLMLLVHIQNFNYIRYVCAHRYVSRLCADTYLLIPNALDFATNTQIADCLTLQAALLTDCRTPVQLSVSKEQSKTLDNKDKK